jgi:3-methyladenine DNA glycosylase AlkC
MSSIPSHILNRKGARRRSEVPEEVIALLNAGKIETINLVEWLVVDQRILLGHLLDEIDRKEWRAKLEQGIQSLKEPSHTRINAVVSKGLIELLWDEPEQEKIFQYLAGHTSDSIREWAAGIIGHDTQLPLEEKMKAIRPFAADHHFGLREIAWLAMRNDIIDYLEESIALLTPWTADPDENIRRFASEATRPRGVWCPHIKALKKDPKPALPLLEPLRADPARYVQLSVGNWLNDASKDHPAWVSDLCDRWLEQSPLKETETIVKRALRTIAKKKT